MSCSRSASAPVRCAIRIVPTLLDRARMSPAVQRSTPCLLTSLNVFPAKVARSGTSKTVAGVIAPDSSAAAMDSVFWMEPGSNRSVTARLRQNDCSSLRSTEGSKVGAEAIPRISPDPTSSTTMVAPSASCRSIISAATRSAANWMSRSMVSTRSRPGIAGATSRSPEAMESPPRARSKCSVPGVPRSRSSCRASRPCSASPSIPVKPMTCAASPPLG